MPEGRSTTDPGFRWPSVWERAGLGWYDDCRERRPALVSTDEARAAADDLQTTLREQPSVFWPVSIAVRQSRSMFNVSRATALRLLQTAPNSALPDAAVWTSASNAPGWPAFKARIFEALKPDMLSTLEEVCAATGADPASVFSGLAIACRDGRAACIQQGAAAPMYFCRVRPGGDRADYSDLYNARVGSEPPAA